jgi:hypothetical protein
MRRSAVRRSTQPSLIAKANNEEIRLARSACRYLQPTYFRMVTTLPTGIPGFPREERLSCAHITVPIPPFRPQNPQPPTRRARGRSVHRV